MIKFYNGGTAKHYIEYELISGYYFDDGFNNKINDFIMTLFNLCLKYMTEKNPLEKTIKLLLNSIYRKSILKLMTYEVKVVEPTHLHSLQPSTVWSFLAVTVETHHGSGHEYN